MSNNRSDEMWQNMKLLPFCILLYDANEDIFKVNSQALSLFDLEEQPHFKKNDFAHITLTNHHSKKELLIEDLFLDYFTANNQCQFALSKQTSKLLLNVKFAKLPNSHSIIIIDILNNNVEEQYDFDNIISNISTDLIDIQNDDVDKHINYALKAIGTVCHADRSYLFKFAEDGKTINNTHEWVNNDIQAFKDDLQDLPKSDLPYFFTLMARTHLFRVNDVTLLPIQATSEKIIFQRQKIKSVLCIGLRYDKELVGFIGCDCVVQKRNWTDLDLIRLRLVGEMLANAFKNLNYKQELQKTQQQLINANHKLNKQVNTDGLTNIANRRCFDQTLKCEIKRGARNKEPISLIMCDIDFFKRYNDNYGHQLGDEVLKQVAKALHDLCKREGDLAARFGGEEFAIILPAVDTDHCQRFAVLIQEKIAELAIEHNFSSASNYLSLSIGFYSLIPNQKTTSKEVITNADIALYNAKETGRNKIASF
ncbi:diguanylate cyclase [Pseudoalteromonas sp. C8]|uniref:diguanylate cyclase domain-containing protein n=1 Tax=Pseudoalteromonas sp. C8 TaxID=2686345 RepID=UPI0013FD8D7D